MRYAFFALLLLMLIGSACTTDSNKLTRVDINSINVPDGFNFETVRPTDVFVTGLYKQTVRIYDIEGNLLLRGLVDPINGLHSKLTLPYTVKQVRIVYGEVETIKPVGSASYIEHSFLPVD